MTTSRKDEITRLAKVAREFRFCGPSDDTDEQTAVTVGYHHLVTQLKRLAGPILSKDLATRLDSVTVDVNDIYSAYTARAEIDALLYDIEEALELIGEASGSAQIHSGPGSVNIRLIALEAGDALKYETTVNEIERMGSAIFPFRRDEFPHDSITSVRAQRIYDWLMSLSRYSCMAEDRGRLASNFLLRLTKDPQQRSRLLQILKESGVQEISPDQEVLSRFDDREFHREIVQHCRVLFGQRHFFHAVFEASKVYNKAVRDKAQSAKDGEQLMLAVWGPDNGVLKVTACKTETDKNVQDGIKFLSAGLMRAVRIPTAHEPALHWPITEQDAVDILSFISFLFRQLDKAIVAVSCVGEPGLLSGHGREGPWPTESKCAKPC
jgi:uncharacterized protein (TIGR02391 family)